MPTGRSGQGSTSTNLDLFEVDPFVIRCLVQELTRRGLDRADLLKPLGLEERDLLDPRLQLSERQVLSAVDRALELTGDPRLGLAIGSTFNLVAWGPFYLGVMACEDVPGVLAFAAEHLPLAGRLVQWEVDDAASSCALSMQMADVPFRAREFLVDLAFSGLTRMLASVAADAGRPLAIDLAQPCANVDDYERAFGCPVRFSRRENQMKFAPTIHRNATADAVTLQRVERWLSAERTPATARRGEVERMVLTILRRSDQAIPSIEDVAAALHLTGRTLRRRLAAAGARYADLLDEHRRTRALAMLNGDHSLDEVAAAAGFADARSLRRAVRRWTGQPPSYVRRR